MAEESNDLGNIESEPESPQWMVHGWSLLKRNGKYSSLPTEIVDMITYDAIKKAGDLICRDGFVCKTPIVDGKTILGPGQKNNLQLLKSFGMKCENMQFSGSFKMRGAYYQFSQIPDIKNQHLLTMSAGNYGTAFATISKELSIANQSHVFMPKTIPVRRKKRIEAFGVHVDCSLPQDKLKEGIDNYARSQQQYNRGWKSMFLHPFDDVNIIIGHGSAGIELLEQEPDVDIVLVCCGGGGFLAGVTAAIRLSGNKKTKIYGVEHTISCTMFDSLLENKKALLKEDPGKTICHGISAPYTGEIPFKVFRAFGDGIIKIEETEVIRAVKHLYRMGLVVEPSGAAAVAAMLSSKVPESEGKRIVAFITGGNVSPEELKTQCGVGIEDQ